jgi:ankyrin repeat protein
VDNGVATFDDVDDGSMIIIGSGQLTQVQVNATISAYNGSGKSANQPSAVLVEGTFTSLGAQAFRGTGFTSIKFSKDSQVTTVGDSTFYGCTMTSLSLPLKLVAIPNNMCNGCAKLLTILIPAPVTSFNGEYAFGNCAELHTVAFGSSSVCTDLGNGTFYNCASLVRIELPKSVASWSRDQLFGTTMASILHRSFFNSFMSAVPTGFRRLITYRDEHSADPPPGKDWVLQDEYLRAAFEGNWTIMQKCLLASPQVSGTDDFGWTAAHYAIAGERIEIVKELFRRNLHNAPLRELCYLAAESGNLELVRGFVGKDDELFLPDIREDLLHRTLYHTLKYGHLPILFWFWEQHPSLVTNYGNNNGQNVLMEAAVYNHVHLVRWILSLDILRIDAKDTNDLTVLELMVLKKANCNLDIVQMLVIDGRAQLNDKYTYEEDGVSSFFNLVPYVDEETLTWMIDGRYVDVEQISLYHHMLRTCSFKMLRFFLLKYNPSRKVEDENERWLEFSYVANRDLDAARWFVKNNYIDVDRKRPLDGNTPLVTSCKAAAAEGSGSSESYLEDIIKLVEVGGANIDIFDNLGKSAWDYLLPLWQDMDSPIFNRVLFVFLPRSKPPQHVEAALLGTTNYRDLVKRGRRVHSALIARRSESILLLGNSSKAMVGLPNELVNIILSYDDNNMSTKEMWEQAGTKKRKQMSVRI